MMRQAVLYRYALPMESGVILRQQPLKIRDGLLVCLREDGREGWGEVAPLPGLSQETLTQAQQVLIQDLTAWVQGVEWSDSTLPSVAFGLSCAFAELAQVLPLTGNYRKALLCHGDPDQLFAALQALPGEKLAKMKVGLYEAVRDGITVNLLLEALPDLQLRLDANRSWSQEKAEAFAKYIHPSWRGRIAFLEEPCRTRAQSREFARNTGIAIAWDESLREADFCLTAEAGVAAIVIKPTLIGTLQRCGDLIAQAHQLGLQAVLSSSMESSLGLTQLARIAAWLTPDTVPGLDTLDFMQAQLVRGWPQSRLPLYLADTLDVSWRS